MKKNLLIFSFFIVLLSLSILDIFEPVHAFSELENRNLSRKVRFTFKSYNKSYRLVKRQCTNYIIMF